MRSATTKLIVVLALIKPSSTAEGDPPATPPPPATTRTCISCASEILQVEWIATGFPVQPSASNNFTYSSNCMAPTSFATMGCSTMCVEALYAVKGTLAVLRGCLGTFLGEYTSNGAGPGCTFGQVSTAVSVLDDGGPAVKALEKPYVGMRLCGDKDKCNKVVTDDFAQDDTNWNGNECTSPPMKSNALTPTDCASCEEYDGTGEKCRQDVSEKRFCKGNWCTKIEGRIAGHWTEIRGCAPFNPLISDNCIKIKREEVNALIGTDIKQEYDLTQCFCNSQSRCNSAHRLANAGAGGLLVFVMMTIAAVYKLW